MLCLDKISIVSRIVKRVCQKRFGLVLAGLLLAGWVRAANPALPVIPTNVFNVTNYGAVTNGSKDDTTNIQNAINAASLAGGGIVEIPPGTFLCGPITLLSSINLQVDSNALLQALPYGTFPANSNQLIYTKNTHDVAISGGGTIDGQGLAWWQAYTNNNNLARPLLVQLYSCDRIFIHDITLQNPAYHHCGIRDNGGNITISNLTEIAPSTSPNTDGIDFVGTNCVIENCNINVGDDNIALGSTGPLFDLVISNCTFGNGHGVSVGSTVANGITNVTVINCSFNNTVNGIRMKSNQDASALVTNLNYFNLKMTNVELPIVIYSYYNVTGTPTSISTSQVLGTAPAPTNSTTPRWSGITISNLNIVSGPSSRIGGIIWGPTEWPISNVSLVCITNNAPSGFDLYNVYGVTVTDSKFNFSSGTTFTVCNAGLTISNSAPGSAVPTIGGATSTNSLALYNAAVSMSSTDLFAANPLTIGGGSLTNSGNLSLPAATVQNFSVGTNASTVAVTGNLALNSTLNINNGSGFAPTNYTLFTYTGSLSGVPALGATPSSFPGFSYTLITNTPGKVMLGIAPPPAPSFSVSSGVSGNIVFSGSGGVTNGPYQVLASTNVALPVSQWTPIATGQFNASGQFTLTNAAQTNLTQEYFLLQEQ